MQRFAPLVTLRLARGELLMWRQGCARLQVLSGSAWVTRPNDPDDHFLHAGQALELQYGLIGAEQDLCLRVEALRRPVALAWLERVRRRLQCAGEQSQISLHMQ